MKIFHKNFCCFALCISISLTSCGPQFRTDYIFTPPKSEHAVNCTYNCENTRQECLYIEDSRQQDCEYRSERNKFNCEEDIRARKNREPKWYECGGETCTADTDRCEQMYRSCYQACGGKVEVRTYCVSNCEELNQPSGKQPAKPIK